MPQAVFFLSCPYDAISILSVDGDVNWFVTWRDLVQCHLNIRCVGLVLPLLKKFEADHLCWIMMVAWRV